MNSVQSLLDKKIKLLKLNCLFIGIGKVLLGLVCLLLTFAFIFAFPFLIYCVANLGSFYNLSEHKTMIYVSLGIATIGTVYLFVTSSTIDHDELGEFGDKDGFIMQIIRWTQFSLPSWTMWKKGYSERRSDTLMVIAWLYFGPRLITSGLQKFLMSNRLNQIDINSCSRVIEILTANSNRVSYSDILKDLGQDIDHILTFSQLRDIDGIMFLESDPPGLSLTPKFREFMGG